MATRAVRPLSSNLARTGLHGWSVSQIVPCTYPSNFFSTSSQDPTPENDKKPSSSIASTVLLTSDQSKHLDATTRGIGQVIFLNSTKSGQVILLSLAVGDPTLAAYAALGAVTATTTAKFIGLDKNALNDGLWGYNGALIGCAASVFVPFFPYAVASTLVGAAITPVLSASLKSATSIPQWTWSFNFIALTSLLQTRPLIEGADSTSAESVTGMLELALSPLVGISQIFVVNSHLTGAGIVGAIGMYSPKLAVHALRGSLTGCLVGLLSGADMSEVAMGLYGYNSALASMAVGTFFVNSRQTVVLSAMGAAASAALFGAMQPVFGMHGVPCLTLPFCTVASACYLLEGHIPGLVLAKEPHSPEKNN